MFTGLFMTVLFTSLARGEICSPNFSREYSDLEISQTRGNIVLYVTYLRLKQQKKIETIEAQGGMGFLGKKDKNYQKIHFFIPFIIPENTEINIKKIKYFIEGENTPKSVTIDWVRKEFKYICNGKIEVTIPANFDFSASRLFISLQEDVWYSYLLIPHGLAITMLKDDGMPSELDENGHPISFSQKILKDLMK